MTQHQKNNFERNLQFIEVILDQIEIIKKLNADKEKLMNLLIETQEENKQLLSLIEKMQDETPLLTLIEDLNSENKTLKSEIYELEGKIT